MMSVVENIDWAVVADKALWAGAWIGLIAFGVGSLYWAIEQRFFGGLSKAMGHLTFSQRPGRPCETRQCFVEKLEQQQAAAERALRRRTIYTLGYIGAIFAPGVALILYAAFQDFLAPDAARAFVTADGMPADEVSLPALFGYFTYSSHFFTMLGDDLVADMPIFANIAEQIPSPSIAPNENAFVFASLVTAYKWISGPILLFSGIVIAEIWGGFQSVHRLIERIKAATVAVAAMKLDEADKDRSAIKARQRKIRRKIDKVMTAQEGA